MNVDSVFIASRNHGAVTRLFDSWIPEFNHKQSDCQTIVLLRDAPKKKPVIKDNHKFTAETFIGMYLHYNNVVFFPVNSKQGILFRLSDQYRSLKNVVYVNGHDSLL